MLLIYSYDLLVLQKHRLSCIQIWSHIESKVWIYLGTMEAKTISSVYKQAYKVSKATWAPLSLLVYCATKYSILSKDRLEKKGV